MKIIKGIPISSGLAMGEPYFLREKRFARSKIDRTITTADIEKHISIFETSIRKSINELNILLELIEEEDNRNIIKSHKEILKDDVFVDQIKTFIEDELFSADFAIHKYFDNFIKYIANVDDDYISQRQEDFYDIRNKLINNLSSNQNSQLATLPPNTIVVAEKITPSIVLGLMQKKALGLISQDGTPNSHSAIIAKSSGIPVVFDLKKALLSITEGDSIILDGSTGKIIIQPTKKQINIFHKKKKREIKAKKENLRLSVLPTITIDNETISVLGNIELPEEASSDEIKFSDGIGLFRTEFLYYQNNDFPSSESHYKIYRQTLKNLSPPKPVYIRVFDIGGDKLNRKFGLKNEQNPYLGCRGIRFLLKYPLIFKNQIRGILRASHYGNIKIMLPMISKIDEVIRSKEIIEDIKNEMRAAGEPFDEQIEIGIMVEVPSAALLADQFAEISDFFSIGTNDLTQYVLAADRNNDILMEKFTSYHPAVLQLIQKTLDAANNAKIPLSICGEMASDPIAVPILLGMGINNLSINMNRILGIKQSIRNYSMKELQETYKEIIDQPDVDIKEYYTKFNQ